MKKNILIIVTIAILGIAGAFWIMRDSNPVPGTGKTADNENSIFFSEDDIRDTDTVVEMLSSGEFYPEDVVVSKGDRVVWINRSDKYAWPASDLHPSHAIYSEFDPLEPMAPQRAWGFVFEKTGEWEYHDHLRPFSTGTVVVEE